MSEMSKSVTPFVVPTCSQLVAKEPGSSHFLAFTSPEKHGGRKVIPGGKLEPKRVGDDARPWVYESAADCAVRELEDETGLHYVEKPWLFMVGLDPQKDVRVVDLKKASDGACDAEVAGLQVQAYFGVPDFIVIGVGEGTPRSDGRESGEFVWVDVSERVNPDDFAAGHDVILLALHRWWKTGGWNGGQLPTFDECADYTAFRQNLLTE